MQIIVQPNKKFFDIEDNLISKAKSDKVPLVCLSGNFNHPNDFKYLVYDSNMKLVAKFIELTEAKKYAEFIMIK